MANMLGEKGVNVVHHVTPLHYLPFIGRSGAILTKTDLEPRHGLDHFRTKSDRHDRSRGFDDCAFLTTTECPPILRAKLSAGFPHVRLDVPSEALIEVKYSLCRFNIAMTRYLRRDGKSGSPESSTNGRYYGAQQIPVAKTDADKRAMLSHHLPLGTMLEVVTHQSLALPDTTNVTCFSHRDYERAAQILEALGQPWHVTLSEGQEYPVNQHHINSVEAFIQRALADPSWMGNGLEFDRL